MSHLQKKQRIPLVKIALIVLVFGYGIFQSILLFQCVKPPENISADAQSNGQNANTTIRNIEVTELQTKEGESLDLLFNGEDLTGWEIVNSSINSWNVEDGILYTNGEGGGWLSTEKMYADFILSLEFRLPKGGNSGVFLRAPREGDPAYTGMEVQILDDYSEKYNNLDPWQYCGSIYDIQSPSKQVVNPAGEWNSYDILCEGSQVKVWLNGQLINDVNLNDHMNKTDTHPGIERQAGYIGLQNHSTQVDFRNIRLKVLE